MAGPRTRAQTKQERSANAQKEATPTEGEHGTPTTVGSSQKGLLDLPPELRNHIYSYAMVRDQPIEVQCRYNRSSRCYGFTMIPPLSLVNRQLRLETLGLFLRESEFKLTREFMQQGKLGSLFALHRMHRNVGLELKTLHICHRLKKKPLGTHACFQCEAHLTLSKGEGRVEVTTEAYAGIPVFRRFSLPMSVRYDINVCGCRIQRFAREFNEDSGPHDIVPFFQGMQEGLGERLNADKVRNEAIYAGTYCQCPGPSGSVFGGSIEF